MATYKSDKTNIQAPAKAVYEKLSDLENLRSFIEKVPSDKIPDDKRQMLDQLEITSDSLRLPGGPVGAIELKLTEKQPYSLIRLEGVGTPVPLSLKVEITPGGEAACQVQVVLDIDIPMMLKPMIGGTLQKVVDQFATVMAAIPFAATGGPEQ